MSEGSRGYEFHISDALFFLTTECVRLHSNQTRRFQTLASLVNQRATAFSEMDAHDAPTLREHLAAVPTKGGTRIYLMLPTTTADALVAAKRHASRMLGRALTVGDALSILLFDYVVERKTTSILTGLGLASDPIPVDLADDRPNNGDNVVQLW